MSVMPVLKRFEILVLKDKGTSPDPTLQMPAAGAQVDFYRQGATVSDYAELESGVPTEVAVYHRGALAAGDTVQVDTSASPALAVGAHPGDLTRVLLTYSGPGVYLLNPAKRLVPTNSRPVVFVDPTGETPTGNAFITAQSDGRANCYIGAYRFDYVITIGGLKRLYVDADGSYVMRT